MAAGIEKVGGRMPMFPRSFRDCFLIAIWTWPRCFIPLLGKIQGWGPRGSGTVRFQHN